MFLWLSLSNMDIFLWSYMTIDKCHRKQEFEKRNKNWSKRNSKHEKTKFLCINTLILQMEYNKNYWNSLSFRAHKIYFINYSYHVYGYAKYSKTKPYDISFVLSLLLHTYNNIIPITFNINLFIFMRLKRKCKMYMFFNLDKILRILVVKNYI